MTPDETLRSGSMSTSIPAGQVPTEDDRYWLGAMRHVVLEAVRSTHMAAFGVIAVSLAGWIITAATLLFGRVPATPLALVMWFLPLGCWTGAIVWALRVFSLRRYRYFSNSPDSAHSAVIRISRRKSDQLFRAIACWVAGVIAFAVAIAYYYVNP